MSLLTEEGVAAGKAGRTAFQGSNHFSGPEACVCLANVRHGVGEGSRLRLV